MKERTLNEYRQTKEYQGSEEGRKYLDLEDTTPSKYASPEDQEAAKQMAKIDPVQKVLAQQIEELEHADGIKEMVDKQECPLDPVEEAKILIVNKITRHLSDVIFEMVNEEMGKNYVFQSQNYLTEAGYEMFEDEWFEFYHEHHGDILYEVMQNITN